LSFSSDTYTKAFEIKKEQRYKANASYERLWEEIRNSNPELVAVEQRKKSLAAKIAIAALSRDTETANALRAECERLDKQYEQMLSGFSLPVLEYSCPACDDTGYIGGKICSCVLELVKKLEHERLRKDMPLDECLFENFRLDYYPEKSGSTEPKKRMVQVLKICREFALNFGKGDVGNLLLLGETGLGKTHLSLAIAGEVIDRGFSVVYGTTQNIINGMSSEYFSYKGERDYTESVLGCDLLILDDMGAEMVTSFSRSCIYNIIDTRILKKLPTIISTNIKLDELKNIYSPRVESRIVGNYTLLQFLGNDIRQLKAIERLGGK